MTTHKFTEQDVEREVRRVASERPDFVYTEQEGALSGSCSYVGADPNTPGIGQPCIVGTALRALGVGMDELKRLEFLSADQVLDNLGIKPQDDGQTWLDRVQTFQDDGVEWGKAVGLADEEEQAGGVE